MEPFSVEAVRSAYDAVASDYAEAFGDDLDHLPVDREILDSAMSAADGDGWVVDVGCGPAPAARYISARASQVLGVDLSGAMLTVAAAQNPGLPLAQSDMRRLPLTDGCCRLAIVYYSLQHLPRGDLGGALEELRRVLGRNGRLVVATHLGEGDVHMDEFLGHRIETMAGALYRRETLIDTLTTAGFTIELERQRNPLPHEYDSRRIYLLARVVD